MPLNFLPEAVPTAIGYAHPLTGEQLTAGLPPDAGRINTTITVGTPGTGYATAPVVTFSAPQLAGGTRATGTATVNAGAVTGVVVTNPGSGYTTAPTITFGGPGTAAAATATLVASATTIAFYNPKVRGKTFLKPDGSLGRNVINKLQRGKRVKFSVQSLDNVLAVDWNYGNGVTVTNGTKDMMYVYPTAGTYTVTATVKFVGGTPANVPLSIVGMVVSATS